MLLTFFSGTGSFLTCFLFFLFLDKLIASFLLPGIESLDLFIPTFFFSSLITGCSSFFPSSLLSLKVSRIDSGSSGLTSSTVSLISSCTSSLISETTSLVSSTIGSSFISFLTSSTTGSTFFLAVVFLTGLIAFFLAPVALLIVFSADFALVTTVFLTGSFLLL